MPSYAKPFPSITLPDGRKIEHPHPEWAEHHLRWRWLLDSQEGGEAYRQADYGYDPVGYPVRNLVRHKREYPTNSDGSIIAPGGSDQAALAVTGEYELRRARTPVPTFVEEAIESHLSKIFNQEISRKGNPALDEWWTDVDGMGQSADQWMADEVGPLLMALGQIDVLFDRPAAPEGEEIKTRADELRLGLDRCVATIVLPENVIWWRLGRDQRYREALIREADEYGKVQYRYWDSKGWTLYDDAGAEAARSEHGYGVVPLVRVFDRRRPRCRNVGKPRYEALAEIQREYYNRDSELILSDTTQAHPLMQGPDDYVKPDGEVTIGPNWVLPKKKTVGGTTTSYEGWDVVQFPKDGAESIRQNKGDLRDAADRAAFLTKPAGAAGTSAGTVGQSGLSKRLDQDSGNQLLGKIAATLEHAEQVFAEFALIVLGVKADRESIKVAYPREFDLWTADELMAALQGFELVLTQVGAAPETEGRLLKKAVRLLLPGLEDDDYAELDDELDELLERRSKDKEAAREAMLARPLALPGDDDSNDQLNPVSETDDE